MRFLLAYERAAEGAQPTFRKRSKQQDQLGFTTRDSKEKENETHPNRNSGDIDNVHVDQRSDSRKTNDCGGTRYVRFYGQADRIVRGILFHYARIRDCCGNRES